MLNDVCAHDGGPFAIWPSFGCWLEGIVLLSGGGHFLFVGTQHTKHNAACEHHIVRAHVHTWSYNVFHTRRAKCTAIEVREIGSPMSVRIRVDVVAEHSHGRQPRYSRMRELRTVWVTWTWHAISSVLMYDNLDYYGQMWSTQIRTKRMPGPHRHELISSVCVLLMWVTYLGVSKCVAAQFFDGYNCDLDTTIKSKRKKSILDDFIHSENHWL